MVLPNWFWEEEEAADKNQRSSLSPPRFEDWWAVFEDCAMKPQHRYTINRGDSLRVSWPVNEDNRLLIVSLDGDQKFALAVGWPGLKMTSQKDHQFAMVRWMPMKMLHHEVKAAYEQSRGDPRYNDMMISRNQKGFWSCEVMGDNQLAISTKAEMIRESISAQLNLWPGPRWAKSKWPGDPDLR